MARRSKKKVAGRRPGLPVAAEPAPNPQASAAQNANRANKIFPRNLTAQAAYLVPGNPVVTRPEDAVANCFPGLEIDIRNLDRRFFPGLVFEFISEGARLAYVDVYEDPDLKSDDAAAQKLYLQLSDDDLQDTLSKGHWYLDWIEQGGKRMSMHWQGEPLGDIFVWRLVRSLAPGPMSIGLQRRVTESGGTPKSGKRELTLHGWRRRYTDPKSGVINGAFQPGELMQGLCSPWQHDFRDCACFYWAANHPDIVLGEAYPGESSLPDNQPGQGTGGPATEPEPVISSIPLDWLRVNRDRAMASEALDTIRKNRPYQFDHFQINGAWQDLSIVLEGREISSLYIPASIDSSNPFASPSELAAHLRDNLGPLEIALTFEYLYAGFSLISEAQAKKHNLEMLTGAVMLAHERILLVAASEMQHLRWVNQMLWGLFQAKLISDKEFVPVLIPATQIPTTSVVMPDARQSMRIAGKSKTDSTTTVDRFIAEERTFDSQKSAIPQAKPALPSAAGRTPPHKLDNTRPAMLRPLTPDVLEEFIAVEHPSAYIDGAYSQVIATLRLPQYPPHMVELALRIASDGTQHETRFREIKAALSPFFDDPIYLRKNFREGTKTEARSAAAPLQTIKENLRGAYVAAANNQFGSSVDKVTKAREAMNQLLQVAQGLAETKNIGIPFFKLWNDTP